jgi:simple sugar transport system ATP-binding protein
MVFQHFSLFETLTIGENIALTIRLPKQEIARKVAELCATYRWRLTPDTLVYSLSYGERQQVEIIRCLMQNPSLLIMDEPTSVLSPEGIERLFVTLRQFASEGRSVLFTSHKLDEVKALCHDATIMRRGKTIASVDPAKTSVRELGELMIGSALPSPVHETAQPGASPIVSMNGVSFVPEDPFGRSLNEVSLIVHPGELVGIVGVSGNGQKELVDLITGEQTLPAESSDRIELAGRPIGGLNIAERRSLGLAFIPEERLGRASLPEMSLVDNALLAAGQLGLVRRGFIDYAAARNFVAKSIDAFSIRCAGPDAPAGSLSGGNLQKFISAREIASKPRLLIAMQPTWGLDVAATMAIRQRLLDLRKDGVGILVVSDDLSELLSISDRIYVMHRGRLSGSLDPRSALLSEISALMTGAHAA